MQEHSGQPAVPSHQIGATPAESGHQAQPLVEVEIEGTRATLFLNRPEKRNAIHQALLADLAVALDSVRDSPEIRVVVLRGRGPVFSSGIDHALLGEVFQRSQTAPFRHLHRDLQAVLNRIVAMEKPVIAVLHGMAVGMALELALAADFRLARADTVMGLPEVAFGILPDVGGTTRLTRLVGPGIAREVILTGRLFRADLAERWGISNATASDDEGLEILLEHWVRCLSTHPPQAVGLAKRLIDRVVDSDEGMALELEGIYQSILITRPELLEHFPAALQWISGELKTPSLKKG